MFKYRIYFEVKAFIEGFMYFLKEYWRDTGEG